MKSEANYLMLKYLLVAILLFVAGNVYPQKIYEKDVKQLFSLMKEKGKGMAEKENAIATLKKMKGVVNISDENSYNINQQLFNEYGSYISDSAIFYVAQNVDIARRIGDKTRETDSKISLSFLYVIKGMYVEATNLLESIDGKDLSGYLQVKYFDTYKQLYKNYSFDNLNAHLYIEKSNSYRDSLLSVLEPSSSHYKIVYAEKLFDEKKYEQSKEILLRLIDAIKGNTHEKAMLTYSLASIYKAEGNVDEEVRYYAISAICDIENAVKENASMHALASAFFELGKVDEAYACIKSSMEDALFCNARLRTVEVSQIFPIIDLAYQKKADRQNSVLHFILIALGLLALILVATIIYIYKQMRRIASIRKELHVSNAKLNTLNNDLQNTIEKLNEANRKSHGLNIELSEANQIKETYIGQFLNICSTYINKLEKFQSTLNKKASERKMDELFKMLKSREMIDKELEDLFLLFDKTFLHLYPSFVEEFNALLLPGERFNLKSNELLNVELRIFALIRLGITDSSHIASFLHYSANTIYNYRTRVRNKAAVPREKFESYVMNIGVIQIGE